METFASILNIVLQHKYNQRLVIVIDKSCIYARNTHSNDKPVDIFVVKQNFF